MAPGPGLGLDGTVTGRSDGHGHTVLAAVEDPPGRDQDDERAIIEVREDGIGLKLQVASELEVGEILVQT